jgi:hypothetical protein
VDDWSAGLVATGHKERSLPPAQLAAMAQSLQQTSYRSQHIGKGYSLPQLIDMLETVLACRQEVILSLEDLTRRIGSRDGAHKRAREELVDALCMIDACQEGVLRRLDVLLGNGAPGRR